MRRLLFALAAGLVLLAMPAMLHAQHRSTYFNGARIYNPGGLGGPQITKSFVCSFWYHTESDQSAVLVDMGDLHPYMMIALPHDIGTMHDIHLAIVAGDFNNTWSVRSQTSVPNNGQWTHIAFAMTTSLHLIAASVNGDSILFDETYGSNTGPFTIPVRGSRWMIGSMLGPRPILPPLLYDGILVGNAVGLYTGGLDQLTCHFADDAYMDILKPIRGQAYAAQTINAMTGQRVRFRPYELGPLCSMPFGEAEILCMRGPPEDFKLNTSGGGTAFTTIEGSLLEWPNSPFDQWAPPQ